MNRGPLNTWTLNGPIGVVVVPIYLPYEFTSVLIDVGNVNPFGIDPEQTVLIDAGNTNPFGIDPEQTKLIDAGNVNPFGIDPEQTKLITSGLTAAD